MGILKLVQEGLLDLRDEIGDYVAIQNETYGHITIQQLMNMDSGLKGYINDDDNDSIVNSAITDPARKFTPEELIEHAFTLTDESGMTPEGVFHYTNTNYILLGMVIENVSGMSYSEFVRREITEPLGLSSTYVPIDNNYGSNVSSGYVIDKETGAITDYSALDLSYVWSAGAVISTASDLCKWMTLIGKDNVVSGDALSFVYNGLSVDGTIQYTSGLINEPDRLWHNGTVLGYHGEMCYLKSGVMIAVLSNCALLHEENDPIQTVMDKIVNMVNESARQ